MEAVSVGEASAEGVTGAAAEEVLSGASVVGEPVSVAFITLSSAEVGKSAAGRIKEPASIVTKKQVQVAAQPSRMRCVFFIVTPFSFLIKRVVCFKKIVIVHTFVKNTLLTTSISYFFEKRKGVLFL